MGQNRIMEGMCVACGMPLIIPYNEFMTCTVCTEVIKKVQYETKMRHISKDKRKTPLNFRKVNLYTATGPVGKDA